MLTGVWRRVVRHDPVSLPVERRREPDKPPAPRVSRAGAWTRWAGPGVALVLSALALALLQRELSRSNYRLVAQAIGAIPGATLALALGLTVLCFAILFWYDWLALRYVGRPLPLHRTALASFIAYSFSQSLGLSALTGASVRFRFWSAWGLTTGEIAQGIAFTATTFWLGALTVGGVAAILASGTHAVTALPVPVPPWAGVVLLSPVALYFGWVLRHRGTLTLGRWSLRPPAPRLAVGQIVVASADWTMAGVVLFTLLPRDHGLTLPVFLAAFLLAQAAGLASHLPGGVGVFDSLILLLLRPYAQAAEIAGALVAYRAIYYLLPLGLGSIAFGSHEVLRKRKEVTRAVRVVGRVVAAAAPYWLSGATFVAGVVLLVSGSTPSVHSRLRWLDDLLPLAVIELSHFTASVVGGLLLLVANGLRRRLDAAWHVAVALLAVGIATSLLKGGDYEEAITLGLVLGAMLPSRRHFYRRAALFGEPLSPGWTVAIVLAIAGTTWLGFFSFKHVDYRASMWWRFATTADAPRTLRATVGVAVALLGYAVLRLLRPSATRLPVPSPDELARAGEIVRASPRAEANLALLGDKQLLYSKSGRSFIMYGVHRGAWIALGDPVGVPDEASELAWRFCEMADAHGGRPVFYEAGRELLPLYVDLGMTLVKMGEEARVPLTSFAVAGGARKGMRRILREAEQEHLELEIVPPPLSPVLWEELAAVSDAWLRERRTREKGFSLGFFDPDYLERFPMAVVRERERVVGFANLWLSAGKEELSVDLMRHLPDAPARVMDFLFLRLMLWGREEGYGWFNLGMAPLSGIENRALAPLWSRLGALVYRHGEHFYNFRGLRQYKDKFDPVWTPRYIASPGGWALPMVLTNVAALVSGGIKGVVAK